MAAISVVGVADLGDQLPLARAYCDFYGVAPSDEDLLALSRALIADPEREGFQLIARDETGAATGFATVFWLWSTLAACRIGLMNDLFVFPDARGTGTADELIGACAARVGAGGGKKLEWQTAHDNRRAQAVYDRIGGQREDRWVDYSLDV
jgi:GNAT superfamily N-acetyltransferase